jgi:PleD family two-component response regulator
VAAGDLSVNLPRSELRELDSLVDAYDKTVADLKQQIAVVDELAHRDALTGYLNKGSFDEATQALDARIAAGEEVRFSLAMLDVNGLKPVNDTQGHEAGDVLLKNAAEAIAQTFGDAPLYRIGGDEFAVLMEGDVTHVDVVQGDDVTIACGVAEYRPGQDKDVASVLARADARMYEHKRSGR